MTNLGRRLRELVLWAGAALGLLAVTVGLLVAFFGFNLLVFRSGSMSPEIPTGALALSQTVQAADVEPGDVVSVIAGNGERITHRVVSTTLRGGEASLVLKGDANATPDSELYVVRSVDRVVASLPYGGYVIVHALTPPGILAVACLSLMLLLLSGGRDEDEWDDGDDDEDDDDTQGDDTRGEEDEAGERDVHHRARNRFRRRAAAGAAFAVLLGGGVTAGHVAGTLAFFTDKATVASGTYTSNKFFDCDSFARGAGSPYLYWTVDESGYGLLGTAADGSGNGRKGQYSTTGISYGQARACADDVGTAITLDGSAGYISTGGIGAAIAGPNIFSLSMWFKTSTATGGKLIGFGGSRTGASTSYDRHIYMNNAGKLVFGVYPTVVRTVTSPLSYNDNQWHQVVATLSAAGMRLYVDGALVANRTDTTTAESYSGWWRVGFDNLDAWDTVPTSRYFAGTVDEVADLHLRAQRHRHRRGLPRRLSPSLLVES